MYASAGSRSTAFALPRADANFSVSRVGASDHSRMVCADLSASQAKTWEISSISARLAPGFLLRVQMIIASLRPLARAPWAVLAAPRTGRQTRAKAPR